MMKQIKYHILIICLIVAGTLLLSDWRATTVIAQSETDWSEPRLLSDPLVDAWVPTIVTDVAGNVHVMWSQSMSDTPITGEGDTLYYTRWDGET